MKEMHNIILILIPSRWFNYFVWSLFIISYLGSKLFILFSEAPRYFNYHFKLHLIHRGPWILFFSSFTSHAFITGVFMVVHHVLIHPRSLHQDSCWSSSILHHAFQLQFFSRIFSDGGMSFLIIFLHVSWFTSYQEWDI